jgi:5-methylcytosine-specific restriction protein A
MIKIPKKKCNKVNCNNLIPFNESYCDEHKELKYESKKQYDKQRYSNDKDVRQTYNKKIWKNIRRNILIRDDYVCRYCEAKGIIKKATLVDHFISVRDSYEDRYNEENLVSSCDRCNTLKQVDEEKLRNGEISRVQYNKNWKV